MCFCPSEKSSDEEEKRDALHLYYVVGPHILFSLGSLLSFQTALHLLHRALWLLKLSFLSGLRPSQSRVAILPHSVTMAQGCTGWTKVESPELYWYLYYMYCIYHGGTPSVNLTQYRVFWEDSLNGWLSTSGWTVSMYVGMYVCMADVLIAVIDLERPTLNMGSIFDNRTDKRIQKKERFLALVGVNSCTLKHWPLLSLLVWPS